MANEGKLSDAEFETLLRLLRRYAVYDMDQWDNFRFGTAEPEVFVSLSYYPAEGTIDPSQAYRDLDPWLEDQGGY